MIASMVILMLLVDECDHAAKYAGSKEAIVVSKREKEEG
jgi:hypothetical protein